MKQDINKKYDLEDITNTEYKTKFTNIEYLTFREGYFVIFSKALCKRYGYKAALLFSELTRMCQTMPTIDKYGYTYISYSQITRDIGMSKDVITPLINLLYEDNIIDYKYTDHGKKKWYKINETRAQQVFKLYNERKKGFK